MYRSMAILSFAILLTVNASPSVAEIDYFAVAGGSTVQATRTTVVTDPERNLFQDEVEVVSWKENWSVGGGVRIYSAPGPERSLGPADPGWEIRFRLGFGGGNLQESREAKSTETYTVSGVETFDYTDWSLGGSFVTRILRGVRVFAGPTIQSVSFEGKLDRSWEGEIPSPQVCGDCGPKQGKSDSRVVYGLLEVGSRLTPLIEQIGLEIFWIPGRVKMSKEQRKDGDFTADFPELDSSWGARLTYDF